MPTGTSTIFGVFQDISFSFSSGTIFALGYKVMRFWKFASVLFLQRVCAAMQNKIAQTRGLGDKALVDQRLPPDAAKHQVATRFGEGCELNNKVLGSYRLAPGQST
jgi:hypothetical protein